MLSTTQAVCKAALKADPTVTPPDRIRLLYFLRTGGHLEQSHTSEPRLIRRAEVARRMGISLRTVDNLARQGILKKACFAGEATVKRFSVL